VTYIETKGAASVAEVKADLTKAVIDVDPFLYHKAEGEKAAGSAKVIFAKGGEVASVENVQVDAPGLALKGGRLGFEGKGHLAKAELPQVALGESRFALAYAAPAGGAARLDLKGEALDAQPFLKHKAGGKPYAGPPLQIGAAAARLRTSPGGTVRDARIALDLETGGHMKSLALDAVAGNGNLSVRFAPDSSGQTGIDIRAGDAGAALAAFGIYENVRGGRLRLTGRSRNGADANLLKGRAALTDFRVVKAPVLARLVNAISLTGLPELLGGEGMSFSRLEADFEWQIRPQGDLYSFDNGRTSGSSLGLTFAGQIDRASGQTDVTGTIVPVTMVNQLVNNIPLIGDILAGGRNGALIAATYKIEGPSDDPDVAVNPLSVLAPGILRTIFFGGD
jgi:hypothetical protein